MLFKFDALRNSGGIGGPALVWRSAPSVAKGSFRVTRVSRAWALSAKWLLSLVTPQKADVSSQAPGPHANNSIKSIFAVAIFRGLGKPTRCIRERIHILDDGADDCDFIEW